MTPAELRVPAWKRMMVQLILQAASPLVSLKCGYTMSSRAELRVIAEAATSTSWRLNRLSNGVNAIVDRVGSIGQAHSPKDADFIATFDPPTVLQLLDVLDAAIHTIGFVEAREPIFNAIELRDALAPFRETETSRGE